MSDLELLRHLCEETAVSGFEEPLISYCADFMRKYAHEVEVDRLGNVIGWLRCDSLQAQTVMVVAHLDELGFVVRRVEDDGLLRLHRVGGIPERVMLGQVVAVCPEAGDRLPGIIGGKSHHVTAQEEKYIVDRIDDVFVDTGLRDKAEVAARGISVGTPVGWWPFFHLVGDRVMSKSLDNRLALYVMLEMLEELSTDSLGANVAFVATVHEEWSAWGSITAADTVNPDLAIVLDVAVADDMPGSSAEGNIVLDGGPVIGTYSFHPRGPHMGTVPNPKLRRSLADAAEQAQIPFQLGTFFGGFTDSSYLQYRGRGVPVADIGLPTRYTHYPVEVASLRDAAAAKRLLEMFLAHKSVKMDLSRG
jgi:putative aminopeptidase FrvX